MIDVGDGLAIGENEVAFSFIRSSGPGGQNVNKVATAAQLRFDAAGSPSLEGPVRRRLILLAGAKASAEGVIVITARRFRSQERNRADALERLAALIRRAATPPTRRIPTRTPAAEKRARLKTKARRAMVKAARARPSQEE